MLLGIADTQCPGHGMSVSVVLRCQVLGREMRDFDAHELEKASHDFANRRALRRDGNVRESALRLFGIQRTRVMTGPLPQYAMGRPHGRADPHMLTALNQIAPAPVTK